MRFRKKPIVIEAERLTAETSTAVARWSGARVVQPGNVGVSGACLEIETLEGRMRADEGDWIIRGVNGEFYPCKPDIFEKTYERCEEEP